MKSAVFLAAAAGWAVAAQAQTVSSNGAMFRGGPAHVGVYNSSAPRLDAVKWRFHASGKLFSSPTVSNGVVYIGSSSGRLYAVRAADGSPLWSFATKGAVNSTPATWNGLVYVSSRDGNVYAVDEQTGQKRWSFVTGGERRFTAPGIHGITPKSELMPDPFDVFLSSPAIAGGVLYIGSGDHNVYAIDAATGALRWRFTTGNVVHASPAVAGGIVYVGSWDRYFYALDARTGTLKWKFVTGDDRVTYNQVGIAGSAAVDNGMVFFGCRDSKFYALDAGTGRLAWKHDEHGSWVIGSAAVDAGTVYYTTSDERRFWALNERDGSERFSVSYGAFAFSSPSLASRVVYFGTFDGRLYAVDTQSGRVTDRFLTDSARQNLPAHLDKNGNLDIAPFYSDSTLDGVIVGLDRIYSLGSIAGSPSIVGGVLYVGSTEGILYAIGA
ncbi:MAG TPA: PQQ-binding-like beta-propeller repeat protein [Candidatus Cybelea sp.]|nr:PQQ-binding-like beta-propeller repeat protein [Candidatus Cybelea sp.]